MNEIDGTLQNLASIKTRSFDVNLTYRSPDTGFGRFGLTGASAASFSQFDRQFRQKPARFIRSIFCTSVRSRRCLTSVRNAAASSSVRVASSRAMGHLTSETSCKTGT